METYVDSIFPPGAESWGLIASESQAGPKDEKLLMRPPVTSFGALVEMGLLNLSWYFESF